MSKRQVSIAEGYRIVRLVSPASAILPGMQETTLAVEKNELRGPWELKSTVLM